MSKNNLLENKLFNKLGQKHYLLLAVWLVINVIQSTFTNLHADESYYWLYSKHLDWGFFDHPPMAALLIYLGDSIMHAEIGVRLFMLLLSCLTVAVLMNELNEKKDLLFLSVFILSFPLMHTHVGGFLALPDVPLVFFTLLFFLVYRRFLEKPDISLSLLLAALAAAMIYSKYHAFLVLGLVFLSNLKLLKNSYFWIVVAGALVLLLPHIFWQIEHDFPTFKYHLHDRSRPLQLKYVVDNIFNQLLVAGPLTAWLVFYSLRKYKIKDDPFKRAVMFTIVGFLGVLFILSFYNRIEAHWTSAIIPLLILTSYPVISNNPLSKKWFMRLALPVVILFFLFRFYLVADFIPNKGAIKRGFYKRGAASEQIREMADGRTVAFFNNWASPGMYEFYSGEKSIHLATPAYRFSQFDLWNNEVYGEGDSLFVVMPDRMVDTALVRLANGKHVSTMISPEFQSLEDMEMEVGQLQRGDNGWTVSLKLVNRSGKTIFLDHPSQPAIGYMHDQVEIERISLYQSSLKKKLEPNEELVVHYEVPFEIADSEKQLVFFTQTIERNRGDMLAISLE